MGIAGTGSWTLVGYYADSSQFHFLPDTSCADRMCPEEMFEIIEAASPAVVLASPRWPAIVRKKFVEQAESEGYYEVPNERLPGICQGKVIVLARKKSAQTALFPRSVLRN